MIEKIEAYKTSDGVIYDDYGNALNHEAQYQDYLNKHFNQLNNRKRFKTASKVWITNYYKKFTITEILASNYQCIPNGNCVYLWYNIKTRCVYVGQSIRTASRVKHFISDNYSYSGVGNGSTIIDKIRKKYSSSKENTWILFLLSINVDRKDLKKIEKENITKYSSNRWMYGYNER